MKKTFFLTLLLSTFLLSVSVSVEANNMKQSVTTKTLYGSYVGTGPFDYTYPMAGWIIRVRGTVDFIDPGGFPHGSRTITITDDNGNTLSWDEPFSYSNPNSPLTIKYPEIEQAFQADISHMIGQ